jgi:hypothetical protein
MATATRLVPSASEAAVVRRAVADAIERLRALELPPEAWTMREVALTGLRALSTALFTDAHAESGNAGALAGLVADEVESIIALVGMGESVAPVVAGRWQR